MVSCILCLYLDVISLGPHLSQGGGKKGKIISMYSWNVNQLETCDVGGVYQALPYTVVVRTSLG